MYVKELETMQDELCPPPEQLREYLCGKLEEHEFGRLSQHIENCEACEQAATAIESEPDTLIELLMSEEVPASHSAAKLDLRSVWPHGIDSGSAVAQPPAEIAAYEILRQLGSGGMGAVYLARHKKLDKQVAIKLLPALPAQLPEFVARFEREMLAAGRLEHPAIVRTTDAGEHEGVHYLVMEAIDGLDLSCVARAVGPLGIADACELMRQAALGLAHAHANGIVHRDIKPSNLILDTAGQLRILDFGLAQIGLWESGSAEITTVGQLMGTLDYMAPEQAERGGAVDYRADLYSLGATLFRLLTGRPPLAAAPDMTPFEKLRLLSTHSAPKLSTLLSDIPTELEKVVGSLLSREPTSRPASAAHAAELLAPWCADAQLPQLVSEARTRQEEQSAAVPARLSLLPHAAPSLPEAEQANDRTNQSFRWAAVLATGLLLLGVAASILFVIETSKGQLVIESVDASVTAKIRQDGQVIDELRIEPGTEITKLWGGKYEITLDAGSDSFSLSNESFTIRRGETVVARVSQRSGAASNTDSNFSDDLAQHRDSEPDGERSDIGQPSDSQPRDNRLDEIVYDGETLDTWLRRVRFERSPVNRSAALSAVAALATPELSEHILPVITERLNTDPSDSDAQRALSKISGEAFLDQMANYLAAADQPEEVAGLARSLTESLRYQRFTSPDHMRPLLDWIAKSVDQLDANDRGGYTKFLATLLGIEGRYSISMPDECRQAVIATLRECETRTPSLTQQLDEFWFNGSRRSTWPEPMIHETMRRTIRLLNDDSADNSLRCSFLLYADSATKSDVPIPSSLKQELVNSLRSLLLAATEKPSNYSWRVADSLPSSRIDFGGPQTRMFASDNLVLISLQLIESAELLHELREAVERFHERVEAMPIRESERDFDILDDTELRRFARSAFFLSGRVLGFEYEQLRSRTNTTTPADRKYMAEQAVKKFADPDVNQRQYGLDLASLLLEPSDGTWATQPLVAVLSDSATRVDTSPAVKATSPLELLSRISGDKFFELYAGVLESLDSPEPVVQEIGHFRELGCGKLEHLEPLLAWCDKIQAGDNTQLKSRVNSMLLSLLLDRKPIVDSVNGYRPAMVGRGYRSHYDYKALYQNTFAFKLKTREPEPISLECQQAIVDRLESYPSVTTEVFWLRTLPYTTEKIDRYDAPLRKVMARRALEVLGQETATQPDRCRASVVLKCVLDTGDKLSDSQQQELLKYVRPQLVVAASNITDVTAFQEVPLHMIAWVTPALRNVDNGPVTSWKAGEPFPKSANECLLSLDLVEALNLAEALKPELEQLHASSKAQEFTSNRFSRQRHWTSLTNSSYADQVAIQAILLRTGQLLGKDLGALFELPEQRMAELKKIDRDTAKPGDTLAIYIEYVLPGIGSPIPVMQAGTLDPVVGFPVPVNTDGLITVPLLPPVQVTDLRLDVIRKKLVQAYTESNILTDDKANITVQMLRKSGDNQEIRSLTSPANVASEER